ncbi:peptidase [Rhodopila sp.]|uniref:peptidase n=1 Tax=Rhodopila sp. TaxID=2480087 RepID=UPI003D14038C
MTARPSLYVALAEQRYVIERPWGDIPGDGGKVTDVVCDAGGHIFVLLRADCYVDTRLPTLIELAPDGRRLAAWGEDIVDGHMLSIGPDGRIYVVDRDAHEVVVFDRTGRRIGGLGRRHQPNQPFNHPCDVAIAPSGDIYVADGYGASRVFRFGADGNLISTWGTPGKEPGQFSTPHGIWALADGRVAVTDRENNRLQVFSASGDLLSVWPDFYHPMDVFQDGRQRLYVTDQVPRLSMLAPDGTLLARCRPVLNGAHGMWGDAEGNFYLAEMNPSRVTKLRPIS